MTSILCMDEVISNINLWCHAVCIGSSCHIYLTHRQTLIYTHTHTHLTALCPGLPGSAGTRKVKTNLDFTEARDSEWQWHQLGRMQLCTPQTRQITTPAPHCSVFLQAGCPSCRPTNSVKALKALTDTEGTLHTPPAAAGNHSEYISVCLIYSE